MPASSQHMDSIVIELMSVSTSPSHVPDWIMLVPTGVGEVISTVDGRGPYRLSDPTKVATVSLQAAGGRIPIDENHATDLAAPNGGPSPARGWVFEMQARRDGIWGRVEWSASGAALMSEKAYRFISPALLLDNTNNVMSVARASLVNTPNLRGMAALNSTETNMDLLGKLREALNLPDDASEEDILAKIRERNTALQSATPDPSRFVPIGDFERAVSEVNKLNQGISLQAATHHVNAQIEAANLLPWLRDWGIALCSVNKPAFDEFVAKTKGGLQGLLTPMVPAAFQPADDNRAALDDNEIVIASRMGLSVEDFAKTKSLNSSQGRNR